MALALIASPHNTGLQALGSMWAPWPGASLLEPSRSSGKCCLSHTTAGGYRPHSASPGLLFLSCTVGQQDLLLSGIVNGMQGFLVRHQAGFKGSPETGDKITVGYNVPPNNTYFIYIITYIVIQSAHPSMIHNRTRVQYGFTAATMIVLISIDYSTFSQSLQENWHHSTMCSQA